MQALPIELFIEITKHLDYSSFLELKSINKRVRNGLPGIPSLNFKTYIESIHQLLKLGYKGCVYSLFRLACTRITNTQYKKLCEFKTCTQLYSNQSRMIFVDSLQTAREIMRLIPTHIDDVDVLYKNAAIEAAIQCGNEHVFDLLLKDSRFDTGLDYVDFVIAATKYARPEMVRKLLTDSRVNYRKFGRLEYDPFTCLGIAATLGHLSVVQVLLDDPRVDPNEIQDEFFEDFPIGLAIESGEIQIVKYLLRDPRLDPFAFGCYAFNKAISCGDLKILKLILADSRFNAADVPSVALEIAIQNGYTEIVRLLLDHGLHLTSSVSPIAFALQFGKFEILKILLQDPQLDTFSRSGCSIIFILQYSRIKAIETAAIYFEGIFKQVKQWIGKSMAKITKSNQ